MTSMPFSPQAEIVPEYLAWQRFEARLIEDFGNAILGASLEPMQMAGPPVRGSLVFAAANGVIFSSGLVRSRIALSGRLPRDAFTLYLLLSAAAGARLRLEPAVEGEACILPPGAEFDALYVGSSLYAAATLSPQKLQAISPHGGTFPEGRVPVSADMMERLRGRFIGLHRSLPGEAERSDAGLCLLRAIMRALADGMQLQDHPLKPAARTRIVGRARDYIAVNLATALTMDEIAAAAETSRRTLYRAFLETLADTPGNYISRLRLHRIRSDLVSGVDAGGTISAIAARWGISEPGRMSARYRALFGENPSDSVAAGRIERLAFRRW